MRSLHRASITLLGLVALAACPDKAGSEPKGGLRVPLPDGWHAVSAPGGLQVGPSGRVVLQLETPDMPFPTVEQLLAPLAGEKVQVLSKESSDSYVGVRYRLGADSKDEGFVGVQKTKARAVWCATTRGAKSDEVEAAMRICQSVSTDGDS